MCVAEKGFWIVYMICIIEDQDQIYVANEIVMHISLGSILSEGDNVIQQL